MGFELKVCYDKFVFVWIVKYFFWDGKRDVYIFKLVDGEKFLLKDLVYFGKLLNYCDEYKFERILGMVECKCNKIFLGFGSCEFLCCGWGYDIYEIVRRWDCNCKFYWCCYVKCKKCKERIEEFRCK